VSPAADYPTGASKLTPLQQWFDIDTGWLNMSPLLNSWVAVVGAEPQYRRVGGIVYLRGRVQSGTSSTDIFVLPAAFRPEAQMQFIERIGATNLGANLVIFATGEVRPGSALTTPNLDCEFGVG
jgi:hypothetical protein